MEDIQQLAKDITKKTIEGLGETFLDIRAALLFIETWQEAYKEITRKQEEDYKKLKVDFTTVKSYSIQDGIFCLFNIFFFVHSKIIAKKKCFKLT